MLVLSFISLIILCSISAQAPNHQSPNPLDGQHLFVIWPRWEGNPKGLSGPLKGGVVLDYLSSRFHFTYEMVRVTENRLEPPDAKGRGLFNYLWDQQCDLLLQDVIPTNQRMKSVDLTTAWGFGRFVFLMPVTDDAANFSAVIKPFQWQVWLLLGFSIISVAFTLNRLQRLPNRSSVRVKDQFLYVFCNLCSQGGTCFSKRLAFRIVAGVWVLAALILVQAYSSILFTYVMSPTNFHLIDTIEDVARNNDINLFVRKGASPDVMFLNNSEVELYRKLWKKLESVPNSRCTFVSDCLNLITPESKNVFVDSISYQMDAIKNNFGKTGKCNLQMSRGSFAPHAPSFALPKHSRYTKTISQGLLELQAIGVLDYWEFRLRPMPPQCMKNINRGSQISSPEDKQRRLSLKNLTGAFVILAVGLSLSLLAFLCERIKF